ncbi:MAG: glycine zipper 2TM domain-containing protein [Acidovorax sp.]|uniref:glycine zipper 2TM domain-containing protein n=1 Tax=Acidovorax sp. TaxID=1872122 RepID=UPI0039E7189F
MNNTAVSPSSNPALPSAPAASVPPLKWLWVTVGALGVCVVALGTTLVVQNKGSSATETTTAAVATPAPEDVKNSQSNKAPALSHQAPAAINRIANQAPAQHPQYPAEAPPALRTAAPAPVCATCGRVESVQAIQQAAPATGVGAVAGGVLGAVVGNQVGKGSGRAAATVLGAVGGGYVGHKVEERTRTHTVYQIAVRMDDGSVRHFTRAQPTAVGTPVVLQGKGFRVDEGMPAGAPQPGAVRVAG